MTRGKARGVALDKLNRALNGIPKSTREAGDGAVEALLLLAATCHAAAHDLGFDSGRIAEVAAAMGDVLDRYGRVPDLN